MLISQQEINIILICLSIYVLINFIIYILMRLFLKVDDGIIKQKLHDIIYKIDEFADKMENDEKQVIAIKRIEKLLGWRKIIIPSFLIGFIINVEVTTIRKLQTSTNTPNLHKEGD